MAWVFTQPPQLRPYLDRWREAGRRDTATVGARKLLALAWAGDSLDALLGDPARAEPTVGELVVAEPAASKSAVDEAGVAVAGGGLSDSASVDGERAATAIRAGLAGLAEYLGALWRAIPTDDDPDAVAGWLTARPADERAWADALVQESWSGHRDRALKEFLAAHAGEQGRAARLVEDA